MTNPATLSFVVLHHLGHGPEHYDLMLQIPSQTMLLSWRITLPPEQWKVPATVAAARLPDHRPLYLTYEGPISKNRGHVQQIAAGTAVLLRQTDTLLELQLPAPLSCTLALPLVCDH